MSSSKSLFRVRAGVSTCRYAWCLGRVDESTASSRTKKKKDKTDKTDACTDVGRVRAGKRKREKRAKSLRARLFFDFLFLLYVPLT